MVGVASLLLALLGITALVDLCFGYAGGGVNSLTGLHLDWSLKGMLGYVLYPFTLAIGVPLSDAWPVAQLIGERVIMTEVKSYQDLAGLLASQGLKDPRSAVIATYALCGFAHVPSLAIFVGGVAALAPSRTADLSRLGFRALLAATLACLMTASVAGIFYTGGSVLFGN